MVGILEIQNLTFSYPDGNAILRDVSLNIAAGEMVLLCGATGSGKTTLLRLLKRELAPNGKKSGQIMIAHIPQEDMTERQAALTVGYVTQHPEQQLVTDKVWHELSFGLENSGMPSAMIARRVAEIAAYFGIEDLFERSVSELSGGQKQLLNLAAVTAMDPQIVVLDEPTAQLDPIAASSFIATLKKINRELGVTVILTEHRTEEVVPVADRLIWLENGKLIVNDQPRRAVKALGSMPSPLMTMPMAVRLFHALGGEGDCPLDVTEGRTFLHSHCQNRVRALDKAPYSAKSTPALFFDNVSFRYDRGGADILDSLNLTVNEGEAFCILGGNGVGKSTALRVACGLLRPYNGYVEVFGKKLSVYKNHTLYRDCMAMLPQDVQTVFLKNSVREELVDADVTALPFDLSPFMNRHPYDLSGGEQQLVALAKVLGCRPRLLLLDEPTKGLDAHAKQTLLSVLRKLKEGGMTIVTVTHDVEFAAEFADRCALFFGGRAVCVEDTVSFFDGNRFYTTAINRITKGYYDCAITLEDAVALYRSNARLKGGDV